MNYGDLGEFQRTAKKQGPLLEKSVNYLLGEVLDIVKANLDFPRIT